MNTDMNSENNNGRFEVITGGQKRKNHRFTTVSLEKSIYGGQKWLGLFEQIYPDR